nr:MAG: protein of unknown function DUF276 [Bacteriophage sp.]
MSRTLTEIYNEAVNTRNKYLELTELTNDSKMSIINSFTWVVATAIYSFETLMDVFTTDIAKIFSARINGTPAYYANAMLKWQYGDDLILNEDGTQFSYPSVDEAKRLITKVSYQIAYSSDYRDDILILKVAKGAKDSLSRLSDDELISARSYLSKIKFAGVKCNVVSRNGDILVPRVDVYYDGAISKEELYKNIDSALINFMSNMDFDSAVYAHRVIDVIMSVDHVVDVHVNSGATVEQGIFIAQYDDNNKLGELKKIDRKIYTTSGYTKQSTMKGEEKDIPTFREAINLKLESDEES